MHYEGHLTICFTSDTTSCELKTVFLFLFYCITVSMQCVSPFSEEGAWADLLMRYIVSSSIK